MEQQKTNTLSSTKVQVTPAVLKETFQDGKILAFTVSSIRRETIDAWVDSAVKELVNWKDGLPFLTLQDFSSVSNFSFTPYMRQRSDEMVKPRPDIIGRTAVVLQKGFSARLVQVFLLAKKDKFRQRRLFFSREAAMNWLEEWLDLSNIPSR